MEHFQSLRLSSPKVVCWAAEGKAMPTHSARRNFCHAHLVDSAAGQVELAIRGRHHIADHSATGRYRGSPKLFGARVESYECVGLHSGLAIPNDSVGRNRDPVGV